MDEKTNYFNKIFEYGRKWVPQKLISEYTNMRIHKTIL